MKPSSTAYVLLGAFLALLLISCVGADEKNTQTEIKTDDSNEVADQMQYGGGWGGGRGGWGATNPAFLIHHHTSVASAVLRSIRHRIPLFPPSFVKIRAQSTSTSHAELDNTRTGRSGSLASPPANIDAAQKIDVNPPKGTRDFPPEEMRLRNWLFQNFREAEAELIYSIVTFFKRIGITASDVGFKVSSRKVLQEVLRRYSVPENLFGRVCVIIDKLEKIPIDDIKKELRSAELSEEAVEELLEILSVKSLTKLEVKLGASVEVLADLKQLFSLAEKYGYSEWIQFDASIVRGLAYYTGIVFEGFDREGKLRAICGGGRYDRLLSTFGGDDLPACGFGFGDAVIVELLKEKRLLPELSPQVRNIVCSLDQDLQGSASLVAARLREKGQSVDLVLENKPLKWVFKRAARINAERLIIVGSEEWQRGMIGVKILSSGQQYEIKVDELE
ncbi:Histidyl-tRNA synthetase 1 [Striga hermonthica]|uniref:histidine--tRNA ligase n=1 Tax=Striga hermonthica TaxID=68872 RepID=A0A9N7MPC3_STRHE|nr:Histidyl-tRNA synthetase 1 [Striga hermonthica]